MLTRSGFFTMRRFVAPSFCLLLTAWAASAQQDRITAVIDTSRTVVLTGNRNARAVPEADLGAVEAGQAISGIDIVFKRTATQQAALDQLLAEQQDPASPNYHNWLTPEEFAELFGVGAGDAAKVAA